MPVPVAPNPFVIRPPADLLEQYPALRHTGHNLARMYANSHLVDDDALAAVGTQLWHVIDVADDFEAAQQAAGSAVLPIIVESESLDVQRLPWETLHHPEHGFLGRANGFTLTRRISDKAVSAPTLERGPLRVLLFTSLPDDLDADRERLNVEEEQAQILEALSPHVA